MRKVISLAFLILAPLTGFARLGESDAELVKRFGPPSGRSNHSIITQGKIIQLGPTLRFLQDDWSIQCDLIDNRCVRINYQKKGDWSEDQIQMVLNSNGQGAMWTETSKSSASKMRRTWRRADGSTAEWTRPTGMSAVWDAYNKARAAAEERAKNEAKQKPKI